MTEIPFHATRMGRAYYEHTVPQLVSELARINATLVEPLNAIERQGKSKSSPPEATTEHGSPHASPLNPNP